MVAYRFGDMQLEGPEGWEDVSIITLVAPDGDKFSANVVVTRELFDAPPDVIAYAKEQAKEMQKGLKRYKLEREEETTVGARNAYLLEHTFLSNEGQSIRQIQVYAAQGSTVFTLTTTDLEETFESRRREMLRTIEGWRLS